MQFCDYFNEQDKAWAILIKNTLKTPEKSCFYWDILKIKRFKIASPTNYDNLETKFRFYGGKPPFLFCFNSGQILKNLDLERYWRKKKSYKQKGELNYEFKQYKSKFKQLNTIGS